MVVTMKRHSKIKATNQPHEDDKTWRDEQS